MRALHIDCSSGISEGRLLAALLDCGADAEELGSRLTPGRSPLGAISDHRNGAAGLRLDVGSLETPAFSDWDAFAAFVRDLAVTERCRDRLALATSRLIQAGVALAAAGASVEQWAGIPHSAGVVVSSAALRAMAGAAAAIELLNIESVSASAVSLGQADGDPSNASMAAALARLAAGVEIRGGRGDVRPTTPCGLALLSALSPTFGPMPTLRLEAAGCGIENDPTAGAGVLLAYLGEAQTIPEALSIAVIETNLDDMPAQALDYVMSQLLERGALDVYFTPIQMKKNRPAVMVSVLCDPERRETCIDILLRETTTLGIRVTSAARRVLERHILSVDTDHGSIPVKAAILDGQVRSVMPEYDVCRAAAAATGAPLRQIQDGAAAAAWKQLESTGWKRLKGPRS